MTRTTLAILRAVLRRTAFCAAALACFAAMAGCRQKMADQPRVQVHSHFGFFPDDRGSRPRIEGTVARGQLRDDEMLFTGKVAGQVTEVLPMPVTKELLLRGQDRYNVYCAVCHDYTGQGNGMIVLRGYAQARAYTADNVLTAPIGHFYDVMTNGFGLMPSVAHQVPVRDRWAIAAYVRVLQLSQNATLEDVPADERARLVAARAGRPVTEAVPPPPPMPGRTAPEEAPTE